MTHASLVRTVATLTGQSRAVTGFKCIYCVVRRS